jgi:hypothetical protein
MFSARGKMITIRQEEPKDIAAEHAINETAFGHPTEAAIVDSTPFTYVSGKHQPSGAAFCGDTGQG